MSQKIRYFPWFKYCLNRLLEDKSLGFQLRKVWLSSVSVQQLNLSNVWEKTPTNKSRMLQMLSLGKQPRWNDLYVQRECKQTMWTVT